MRRKEMIIMVNRPEEQSFQSQKMSFKSWKVILLSLKNYKGTFLSVLILNLIISICEVIIPYLNKVAIDEFVGVKFEDSVLWGYIFRYVAVVLICCISFYLFFRLASKLELGLGYDLKDRLYRKIQSLSFNFFDTNATGWLVSRMTSDINRLAEILAWSFTDLSWSIPTIVVSLVVMIRINPLIATIVSLVFPFVAYVFYLFQKRILANHREIRRLNSTITNAFSEGINGAKTTKTLVLEDNNYREFKEKTADMYETSVRASAIQSMLRPIINMFHAFVIAVIIWLGGGEAIKGLMTFGELTLFASYANQMFWPVQGIAGLFNEIQICQANVERVSSILTSEAKVKDSEKVIEKYGTVFDNKYENFEPIKGDIEFKNVDFHYIPEEPILNDFNLKVKAGQTVALVGETGSGKSTIVNLLCRFYEPINGEILIDGIDYRERSIGWLHSNIGYVLQAPHLFSGTIMDNVRYGKLEATDEEIIKACKLVNADEFISRFENGYNTDVGEDGNRLSTGQKQLISFARAVLRNPAIFILDEATSSIDTETEAIIQYAIENIMKDKTSFVIAHRLSTIVNSDIILAIKDGKIVEAGDHNKLLAQKGYYYRLYTNQFNEDLIRQSLGDNKLKETYES